MTVIEAYRSRHAINVKSVLRDAAIGTEQVCMVDGLRVNRIRGGWRHDATAVREAAENPRTYDPKGDALRAYRERHDW